MIHRKRTVVIGNEDDPDHNVHGVPCWCDPFIEHVGSCVVVTHRSLFGYAMLMKERTSSACCGEDPGGDNAHWMKLAREQAAYWWSTGGPDRPGKTP